MKLTFTFAVCCWPWLAFGELAWLAETPSQIVFAGSAQRVKAVIKNSDTNAVRVEIWHRLFQLGSATAMPMGEARPWKFLEVSANQTINESVEVTVPEIKSLTQFSVHWLDAAGKALGATEIVACPAGVIRELNLMAGSGQLGVWDPENQITPLLNRWKVEFEPLMNGAGLKGFTGRVAIVGPVTLTGGVPADSMETIRARARGGMSVVWLHPGERRSAALISSRVMEVGEGTVVTAPATTVANLAGSPESQLNLITLVELAVRRTGGQLETRHP